MPRSRRSIGSDWGHIRAQSSTYTQRQKYLLPALQPDDVLWGEIKELQARAKSQRFPIRHLPRDSICFSPASERAGTAPVPKSLPQQMLQKVDVLRGYSLTRNSIQAEIFVNSHLKACNKPLFFSSPSHPFTFFDSEVHVLV